MSYVSSWDKFKLLLWKNWILQWNQKCQLALELLLPALFSSLMVLIRTLVVAEPKSTVDYPLLNISNLDLFKAAVVHGYRKRFFLGNSKKSNNLEMLHLAPVQMKLLYSPINPILNNIVQEAANSLDLDGFEGFPDSVAMEMALLDNNVLAGIQFSELWSNIDSYPEKFSYSIRFPSELRTSVSNREQTWLTMKLFLPFDITGPRNINATDGGLPVGYLREGFLPVQHAISMAYMKLLTDRDDIPEVYMQRYPYPEYIFDPLLQGLAAMMPFIILLSFIYPWTSIVKYVTAEKEKQLKEVMKIMGLDSWIHWTAWFVKCFITLGISATSIVILMKVEWSDDVAVLTYTDWSVLLIFMWIYVIASICFCFMLATMFSRASTAAAVTGLVCFIAYLPFSFMDRDYNDLSLGTKLGWSLISNTAMGFGFKLIMGHEGNGEGLQWSNLFEPINVDDDFTVGYIMLMMLLSSVIYMLICLYVEQIFPGNFGVPKKWNFPITALCWWREKDYVGAEAMPNCVHIPRKNPEAFELEPSGKHVGIEVKNLKKVFGPKLAVNGLSVNMYEDDITVLLGHNGAGKTTTISMLTGMLPPSSGTAIINGSDITTDLDGARMSLGVCPQHNVLFDNLTVADHLKFFSRLKGLKDDAVEKEVNKYLKIIELEDKRNVASKKLSGGMKRKLSVCCALCGDTKVVLCDEPSSGMDPGARRQLWNLLQAEKAGRTILLTTHFMDEADVLGDRIAIMCDGELKCCGTPFFLKKKYGSGYKLICVKRDDCNVNEVTALLRKYVPNLEIETDIGAELSYQLPDSYSNLFEEMFRDLEENSEGLQLNGYGIGITSLEEVFMKVGAEKASDDKSIDHDDDDKKFANSNNNFTTRTTRLLGGLKLWENQWHAMLLKKFLYTYRNKLMFFIQNAMAIFFVVVTILITRTQGTFRQLQPMTVSLTQYPTAVTVLERSSDIISNSLNAKIADHYKEIATSYGEDYTFESTNEKSFRDYILELGSKAQVRINARYLAAASVSSNNIIAWLNNQPLHTAPLTVNLVHNAMVKALKGEAYAIEVTNAPLPYSTQTVLSQLNTGNNLGTQLSTNLCFCFCFISALYILFLIKERETRSKLLQLVGGVNVWTFWLSQLLWDLFTFIITALIVIIAMSIFQEDGYSTFNELMRYFSVLILFGFSVLPFTYLLSFLFKEPANGFAYVSSINVLVGLALFLVVLVMSFEIFDTKDTAEILGWIFRIFPHFCLAMGLNKLYMNGATRETCSNRVIDMLPDALRCQFVPRCCESVSYYDWNEPGILPEVVYLLITGVVFLLIVIAVDYGFINELIYRIQSRNLQPSPPEDDSDPVDDDVKREKQYIEKMSLNELRIQNLVVDRVTKYYKKFLAVNQLSICVKPEECFGLLGINGAGKTTTFKMLTGDERISHGTAYIRGMNLSIEKSKIYKEIGYCPQFDALLDDLTGRETLKIFCLIRGIRKENIDELSEELAKSFGFMKHLDKETRAYSGGNKRKLSAAIAVIGSPSVIYLDEPTSGIDPAARRQLWNMVCRIRDSGKSIILTSHNMEECEALCTRLAIMVNGKLKCIGSTQHLKNKFSKGLILKIKVKSSIVLGSASSRMSLLRSTSVSLSVPEQEARYVKQFVEVEFPQAVLKEEYQGILTFYIPLSSIKWSQIFGLMERNRDQLNIEDYSISQTTLEEIFLDFAKHQREDARVVN
ncbi:phospholipid-transporting ATPase ABCA1 isoform X1 [Glossina fuscipes]|uniref:Phospholipid-transporting ATPase ABCA1 isoform X1 n=1 Tax=Glossina fuscipes TaxID=7396 RepID=A0A8U0WF23_9MUSC|nr:phospholipid-transporting ATPase ABCA1 isoform X1 [Glossina fuscipes]